MHADPTLHPGCELCERDGGVLVHATDRWRVIRAEDANFPAFYRVIWRSHVAEFTDLAPADRRLCLDVVCSVEQVLREALSPTKINLASLGNIVPHLHWHVIARFNWDSHFPQPVWGQVQRAVEGGAAAQLVLPLPDLDARVRSALVALPA